MVQFIHLGVAFGEFVALQGLLAPLLQGRLERLLELCLVHAVAGKAVLHVVGLLLLIIHDFAELSQLVLEILAFVLRGVLCDTLIML